MEEDCRGGWNFEEDVQGEVRMVLGIQARKKVEQHWGNEEEKEVKKELELEMEVEKELELEMEVEMEVEKRVAKNVERGEEGMEGMVEFEVSEGTENDMKKLLMQARVSYENEWKEARQKTDAARTARLSVEMTGRRSLAKWEDQEKVADTNDWAFLFSDGRIFWE